MPKLPKQFLVAVLALSLGAGLGYLVVDAPIIPAAPKFVVQWSVPYVEDVAAWLRARDADYFLVAALVFISIIPNVVLLAFLVAVVMIWLRRPRLVFYGALVWPLVHYLLDVERVMRIKTRAAQENFSFDTAAYIKAEHLPTKAVGMLLVYLLFSTLAFLVYRRLSRTGKVQI